MKPVILLRTAIVLSSLVLAGRVEVVSAQTPFVHETMAVSGLAASLALDSQGNPGVSYINLPIASLQYASKSGVVWTFETVDGAVGGIFDHSTSLARDALGNPRISYYSNSPSTDLLYASKSGGVWTLEVVDGAGVVGQYNSLALDASGNPRISYYDVTNGNLKYASKSGGVWTLETVDATGDVGRYTSIALDASGNPRISYYDFTNGDLKYASKDAGAWTLGIVDAAGSVGLYTSIALDASGNPRISYYDDTLDDLKLASRNAGVWTLETVDAAGDVGRFTSIELGASANPRIAYHDGTNTALKYASKNAGVWTLETVDATVAAAFAAYPSLALDAQGNPRISYPSINPLKYTDSAVHILDPSGGETWPVGSLRSIRWSGVGTVDVFLSVDGGRTYDRLREGLIANTWEFLVPHAPTHFARLRVQRSTPLSTSETVDFFTIEGSISLLALKAEPVGEGVLLSWHTDPGPADLAGYKLERHVGESWRTVVGLTREIAYTDPEGSPGDRYRLTGINGLGEEILLGEIAVTPRVLLAASPLPYRSGDLSVSFAAAAGPGGTPALTEVSLYDLSGRLVRTIFQQSVPSGYYTAAWDGRDDSGEAVPSGLYFLRSRTAGSESTYKVTVLR